MDKIYQNGLLKKKIIWLVFVVLVVVSIGAYLVIKNIYSVPKSIKIGWPVPITGSLSSFGEADPWLAEKITKIVNEDRGGIYLSKYGEKVPIEILIRDTKSDPEYAAVVAKDLIVNEKIDLMVVLHTPDTTIPVSHACENYKVPCIVFDTPVLAWLGGAPYEWSFLHFWAEPDLAEINIGMWDLVKNSTNKKAGGLWNNDADGTTMRDIFISVAKDHGYDFVGDEGLVPYNTEDYSSYISDLKEKGVELLTMTVIPPNFSTFWKQSNAMGFHPKVATIAKAILFPSTVEELGGDSPSGLGIEVWWSKFYPGVSSLTGLTSEKLSNLWEKESGRQRTQPLFYSLGALETAVDSLERAGSIDKVKVRDAVADTDLNTIIGRVSFKAPLSAEDMKRYEKWPALIKYKNHYSLAPIAGGQWRKGTTWPWEIQIVYNWKYDWIPQTAKMVIMSEQSQ